MLQTFFKWLESLTWAPALCFIFALFIVGCLGILLIGALIDAFGAWRERRAIRERNHLMRMQRVQLILDAQRERELREAEEDKARQRRTEMRVWRDRVQSNRESRQFHVPAAFRDMKGVHK